MKEKMGKKGENVNSRKRKRREKEKMGVKRVNKSVG
jgi:hypothetical protein